MTEFALLFPGQGAQFVGMGKDLAQAFPAARALFHQADALTGYGLSHLCWEGPAESLTRTEHCQPALYVTALAALAALESALSKGAGSLEGSKVPGQGLEPSAAAGLSLGEYTALAAAGALSFTDGLKLVHLRGQAMEEAARSRPGTMASILGLERQAVEAACGAAGAQVANLNSPGQIVISGTHESVAAASTRAREKGAKRVIPLEVGGAFHSRLMELAGQRLQQALAGVPIHMPRYPVLSNVTGGAHDSTGGIRRLLVEQLTQPVQWIACVQAMLRSGIRTYIEVGPGTVLKGLVRKIDPEATVHSAGTAEEIRNLAAAWGHAQSA